MHLLAQILEGKADAQALEALRSGCTTWLRSASKARSSGIGVLKGQNQLSLARCLHIPASPERARKELRNYHLREAAKLLPVAQSKPWTLAEAVHREAKSFAGHQWLCWVDLQKPPSYCSDVNRHLFWAMLWGGGKLPSTTRSISNIINS
jgi:hypothetical protein